VVLTLSSHEPFDVPMEPVFKGKDDMTKYRNSVFYADKTLGAFIDWAKERKWWKNTLVVLVADHGARISEDILNYEQKIFKIPMLWIGGAVTEKGIVIDKLGSQVDIPVTILNQFGIINSFPFAKDLLSDQSKSFAFYTFNEGFGFITDSSAFFYDHKLKQPVLEKGKEPDYAGENGKAYLQVLFNDYLKR
jgi:phosphoglycerol transferase MdoB-like AlkP superfamily enzyme